MKKIASAKSRIEKKDLERLKVKKNPVNVIIQIEECINTQTARKLKNNNQR